MSHVIQLKKKCCCESEPGEPCALCTGTPNATFRVVLSDLSFCDIPDCIFLSSAPNPPRWFYMRNVEITSLDTSFIVTQEEGSPCFWSNDNIGTVEWDSWVFTQEEPECDEVPLDTLHHEVTIAARLGIVGSWFLDIAGEGASFGGETFHIFHGAGGPTTSCVPTTPLSTTTDCTIDHDVFPRLIDVDLTDGGTATIS